MMVAPLAVVAATAATILHGWLREPGSSRRDLKVGVNGQFVVPVGGQEKSPFLAAGF